MNMAQTPGGSTKSSESSSSRQRPVLVFAICGFLLIAFAILSFTAEKGKCATGDEPMHGLAAYILKEHDDYRFNSEDPALWQHWTSLAEPAHALKLDFHDSRLNDILSDWAARWRWIGRMLYMTPGNDPDAFLRRERYMLIPLGIVLGALMALWSWRLAGGVAAVAAATIFAFDPNFLAHSAQIKNDVPITLTACALAYTIWRAGRRLSGWSLLGLLFTASLPMVTKFSGPLQIIFLGLLLAFRAILPIPWNCFGRQVRRWYSKAGVGGGLFFLCGLAAYVTIWASYSFRFTPTTDGSLWVFKPLLGHTALNQVSAIHPDLPDVPLAELQAWKPDMLTRTIEFCNQHRLLPQTFLYGMLYTYQSAFIRATFLCGRLAKIGCWQYFPLAYLFKTPIGSQIAVLIGLIAVIAAGVSMFKLRRQNPHDQTYTRIWDAASLIIPFAVLFSADLRSKLDLGIRHMLPVYPFLYIMAAVGVAIMIKRFGDRGRLVAIGLALALVTETALAFPNYIAFFNTFCGGSRGGLRLLGDSNLDWGQDLPALAQWQHENPDANLYLCYFGSADPVYYGIRYQPFPGTLALRDHDNDIPLPRRKGVIAISATLLQGLYLPVDAQFRSLLMRDHLEPIAVLNGSIYLYEYDLPR
jgi:hypothetical protein